MRYIKPSLLAKFSTLAAALALQGAVFAATPPATTPSAPTAAATPDAVTAAPDKPQAHRHHKMSRHHHSRTAMWVPGYGPLGKETVQSLALTDTQAQLLKEAQGTQKELRKKQRLSMRTAKKAQFEQIKEGKMDPHSALKESASLHLEMAETRQQTNQKWLAVWDALDTTQREKIAAHFEKRGEKMAAHATKHGERSGKARAAS